MDTPQSPRDQTVLIVTVAVAAVAGAVAGMISSVFLMGTLGATGLSLMGDDVSDEVMDRAGIDNFSTESEVVEPITSEELTKEESGESVLENLNEALEKAITEEEYEMAARLRDRIKQLEKESTS